MITNRKTAAMKRAIPNCTFAICILPGGLSSRMGRDKSRMRCGPKTLLGYAREAASKLGVPIRVIRKDSVPRCGPIGGVLTALKSSRADAEIFLACDMPFVSERMLRQLIATSFSGRCPVFSTDGQRVGFPFLLPSSCLLDVEHQIKSKSFSLQGL